MDQERRDTDEEMLGMTIFIQVHGQMRYLEVFLVLNSRTFEWHVLMWLVALYVVCCPHGLLSCVPFVSFHVVYLCCVLLSHHVLLSSHIMCYSHLVYCCPIVCCSCILCCSSVMCHSCMVCYSHGTCHSHVVCLSVVVCLAHGLYHEVLLWASFGLCPHLVWWACLLRLPVRISCLFDHFRPFTWRYCELNPSLSLFWEGINC